MQLIEWIRLKHPPGCFFRGGDPHEETQAEAAPKAWAGTGAYLRGVKIMAQAALLGVIVGAVIVALPSFIAGLIWGQRVSGRYVHVPYRHPLQVKADSKPMAGIWRESRT